MISLPDILLPKKKYIGISIERTSIHAVELDERYRPIHISMLTIPDNTFVDGSLSDINSFSQNIQTLLNNGKFTTPYVVVCFPEVFAYTRACSLPLIPMDEVQEAISWRSKELFPFPQEEMYFDWKLLRKTDGEYQTIVVAVQRRLLDGLVSSLIKVGLKPLRFEPDASALVRLLKLEEKKHAVLVEVNPKGAYITLVEGEKAIFTTVVNKSADDTPTTYVSAIDQTLQEIGAFYTNKGILQENNAQVFVTGELASDEWVKHLGQVLKYPAALLQSPLSQPNFNKAYAAVIQKIAPPSDEQSINLMPTATQAFYDQERNMQIFKTLLIRFNIIAGIFAILSAILYFSATFKNQQVDLEVKAIRKMTQSQQTDTQSLLLLNAQAKNIVMLAPLRVTPASKIASLAKLMNDKITISQWEYDDSKLSFKISGIAQTRSSLLEFRQALDNSDDFANVTLPLDTLVTPVNVSFEMSFVLKK